MDLGNWQRSINEAVKNGDFTEFDKLSASEKIGVAKNWTHEIRIKYLSRNSVSEEELFNEIYKIIDNADN